MSSADLRCATAFRTVDPDAMRWRGQWGIPGIYQFGDVAVEGGTTYVCTNPSGSVAQQPSQNPSIWEFLSGSSEVTKYTILNNNNPLPNYPGETGIIVPTGSVLTPLTAPITVDPTHMYRVTIPLAAVLNTDVPAGITAFFRAPSGLENNIGSFVPVSPAFNGVGFATALTCVFQPTSTTFTPNVINYSAVFATQIITQGPDIILEDLGPA